MSPDRIEQVEDAHRFPRVSGDEPHLPPSRQATTPFSPRERG